MANVLIVDDSSTMRKIISRSLRQAGLAVDDIFEAGDGIEGLYSLTSNKVDLILSDINMPTWMVWNLSSKSELMATMSP